jgi:hypothetical protein
MWRCVLTIDGISSHLSDLSANLFFLDKIMVFIEEGDMSTINQPYDPISGQV